MIQKKQLTFEEWLTLQVGRNDPVGKIAEDIALDPTFPHNRKRWGVDTYLRKKGAYLTAIAAYHAALTEYEQHIKKPCLPR